MNPNFLTKDSDDSAASGLSYLNCLDYCNWLNRTYGFEELPDTDQYDGNGNPSILTGFSGFRLPTSAEWEYASRGRTSTPRYHGTLDTPFSDCYIENSKFTGPTFGNRFGLLGIHSNHDWTMTRILRVNEGQILMRGSTKQSNDRYRRVEDANWTDKKIISPHTGFRIVYVDQQQQER
ncbi:MAG: SUMF1/EgtB/PvdO family nonheme iron enzyme [Pirellula sp.]